jgi:OmpA family protein
MAMTRGFKLAALTAILALAGCVTAPTGPRVTALPGSAKNYDQFQADDVSCRQYAQSSLGVEPAKAANDAAGANALIGTGWGAAMGAAIGSASAQAGPGAAIGAGVGLLFGSIAGSNAAGATYYATQRQYDSFYLSCMYARGNQVPAAAAPRYYRAPPPYGYPYPAPAPPASPPPAS